MEGESKTGERWKGSTKWNKLTVNDNKCFANVFAAVRCTMASGLQFEMSPVILRQLNNGLFYYSLRYTYVVVSFPWVALP